MEMNMGKFSEKLVGLLELAKKKKNVLEYQEISDYFKDQPLDAEQMDKIFDFLEASGVDVLRITENSADDLMLDDDMDIDGLDDEEEVEPVKKFSPAKSRQQAQEDDEPEEKSKRSSQPKVTPIHRTVTKKMPGTGMEVCVIKPTSVEDAREITETLLANRTVVLNLEGLDVDIAQRIIDFTSGSCFAISGNLQKISHYIFIITPASVDISGDFQDFFGGAGSFEMPINNGMS